jgi:transposase
MSGFIEGDDRHQVTLFPECLDDYVGEESPVRVIDVFVDDLDLSGLGFKTVAEATGRPGYHPATLPHLGRVSNHLPRTVARGPGRVRGRS